MPYVGIDQSLNGTGLCRLSDEGTEAEAWTIDAEGRRGPERLLHVKNRVSTLLGNAVQFVCVEGYAYDSVSHHHALGEVGGVLKLLIHERGIPQLVVPPASLKKFATGNSRASKEDMVAAVPNWVKVDDDNQADAFFLACVARFFHLGVRPQTRAQMEVLRRLAVPQPRVKRRVRKLVKNAL